MRQRSYVFYLLSLTLIAILAMMTTACSDDDHSRVREEAKRCYEYLQEGKYEKFVGQIAYADSMSEDYRSQMIDVIAEYDATMKQQHGQLVEISVTGDTIIGEQAHVYLQLSYADSTSEEVGVPMVKVEKKWMMQ